MSNQQYVEIGDVRVPALGFGTWQIEGEECTEAVKKALDTGYRHIDTAQIYGNEERVGDGIRRSDVERDEIFLTTKIWRDRLEPEKLKQSVEASLERLGTDYVDLLLIHWPFPELDLEAVLEKMNELVEEGKARNIGVSNFTSSQMERAQALSDAPIFTNQVEYHPYLNQDEVLSTCRDLDAMLTAYSPLARGEVVDDETLQEIAQEHGKTAAQVALRWLVQQDNVCAIPKASSPEHIEQNLEVFDFELTAEEMERISELEGSGRQVDPDFAPQWD